MTEYGLAKSIWFEKESAEKGYGQPHAVHRQDHAEQASSCTKAYYHKAIKSKR